MQALAGLTGTTRPREGSKKHSAYETKHCSTIALEDWAMLSTLLGRDIAY